MVLATLVGMATVLHSQQDNLSISIHPELVLQSGHRNSPDFLQYARGGRWLISASESENVKIWDLANGRELRTFTSTLGPPEKVQSSPDSSRLALVTLDNLPNDPIREARIARLPQQAQVALLRHQIDEDRSTIELWDINAGLPTGRIKLNGHIFSLAFTPDNKYVLTVSSAGVSCFSTTELKEMRISTTLSEIDQVAIAPDGQSVFLAGPKGLEWIQVQFGNDRTQEKTALHITRREVLQTEKEGPIRTIAVSSDGQMLAATFGGRPGTVQEFLQLLYTGKVPPKDEQKTNDPPEKIRLWKLSEDSARVTWSKQAESIRHLSFSHTGKQLVGDSSGSVLTWNAENGTEQLRIDLHDDSSSGPEALAISPDAAELALSDREGLIRIFDLESGNMLRQLGNLLDTPHGAHLDAESGNLLILDHLGAIRLLNLGTGALRIINGPRLPKHLDTLSRFDRKIIFTATPSLYSLVATFGLLQGSDSVITIRGDEITRVSTATGQIQTDIDAKFSRETGFVSCHSISMDGRMIATGHTNGAVRLFDSKTGKEIRLLVSPKIVSRGPVIVVLGLAFSWDGRLLAVLDGSNTITIWDLISFEVKQRFAAFGGLAVGHTTSLAFSPAADFLVTANKDGILKIWDVGTGLLHQEMRSDNKFIRSLVFSMDGKSIIAGGPLDPQISIWDFQSGQRRAVLADHHEGITSLSFANKGRLLVSTSFDGSTRIYDLTTGSLLLTMVSFRDGNGWLAATPDGLFEGTADAAAQVLWRRTPRLDDVVPLDTFFTDFYYPGLLAEILEGARPKAQVDIATMSQIPSLRTMLADKNRYAHLENHEGRLVVCFDQQPGAVINVGPGDVRMVFPPVNGYKAGTTATCRFEKELPNTDVSAATLMAQLQDWKPHVFQTTWDGQLSGTKQSILHVMVVGITQYPRSSGFAQLPYATLSAKSIEEFFKQQAVNPKKPFAAIRVWEGLYDSLATRERLRQRWAEMAQAVGKNDVVLMYLAGHGRIALGQEMFYFIPVDGRDGDMALREKSVSTAIMAEALRNLPARRIVLIIDACQSGGAIEALGKIGVIKARAEQRREQQEGKTASGEQGVGVHLIAATLPLSYAVGPTTGLSALAQTLLKALNQGSGMITIEQVAAYVNDQLPTVSDKVTPGFQQIPLIHSIGLNFPLKSE